MATIVKQIDARNAKRINEDLEVLKLRLSISDAQCGLVQYRNPSNKVVLVVSNHPQAGVYEVTKGPKCWLGHNGYKFGSLDN